MFKSDEVGASVGDDIEDVQSVSGDGFGDGVDDDVGDGVSDGYGRIVNLS